MTWKFGTPNKSGHYLATYTVPYVNAPHVPRVTSLYWDQARNEWNCEGGGNHGFAENVDAWMEYPAPYRRPA